MKYKWYCENCFKEYFGDEKGYTDNLGSVFCDKKCYLESLEYRDVEKSCENCKFAEVEGIYVKCLSSEKCDNQEV